MANECFYEMRITGKRKNLEAFKKEFEDPSRLGKVIEGGEIDVYEKSEEASSYGRCSWNVESAFNLGDAKCPIRTASRRYSLFIEIFSEEDEFQEHYVIKCGDVVIDESYDRIEVCKDDYDNYEEFNEEWGTNYTEKEFEALGDYIVVESGFPDRPEYMDFSVQDIDNYTKEAGKKHGKND